MLSDVMDYFGLKRAFDHVGYFETEQQVQLFKDLKPLLRQGRLIGLSGIVGSGKTTALQRLQSDLAQEKDILLSRCLAVDKDRVSLGTLMNALFYDLATDKDFKLPTQPEQRERKLLALIQKRRKPVALLVDEAHDLHSKTLVGLKRLMELVRYNGCVLSVLLAGHPKLKNDLRRPALEEIGARADVFTLEGIRGHQQQYIQWLLRECTQAQQPEEVLSEDSMGLLAERLTTPLQIEHYLRLTLEEAYKAGQKPVTPDIIELVLAQGLDDLEPRLIRHGYNVKVLADLLNVRNAEIRSFLQGQLSAGRSQDLRDQMLRLGIPV
jgi:type II secretory pathway predicted ATPase ExeA